MHNSQQDFRDFIANTISDQDEVAGLHQAYDKWLAAEDPAFVGAHVARLPFYLSAKVAWTDERRVVDNFMGALEEYWIVHHWSMLVHYRFFENLVKHLPHAMVREVHHLPTKAACLMLRSSKRLRRMMPDLLHRTARDIKSPSTVAAYIYKGGINPFLRALPTDRFPEGRLALELAKDSGTQAVLKAAMVKVSTNAMAALRLKHNLPEILVRECMEYLDVKGKDFVPLSPSDEHK
jgi:hypothetical protein